MVLPHELAAAVEPSVRVEDLDVARVVGRFFVPANGPERDPALREAMAGRANVTVTEGRMGEGVYEAIVSTLAGA